MHTASAENSPGELFGPAASDIKDYSIRLEGDCDRDASLPTYVHETPILIRFGPVCHRRLSLHVGICRFFNVVRAPAPTPATAGGTKSACCKAEREKKSTVMVAKSRIPSL